MCFSGSYGFIVTECGRRNSESHFVQSSVMLPAASTTTTQCSQRASTPSFPFQPFHPSLPWFPGLAITPTDALRNGVWPTGKEMLGPVLEGGAAWGGSGCGGCGGRG